MNLRRLFFPAMIVALCVMAAPNFAEAQNNGGGRQGRQQRGGNNGQGGNFDPAQARQRALDRVKAQLGATDDEWKVLQPKIEKLMTAQRDARAGGRGGRGNRGQNQANQNTNNQDQSAVAKAMSDLRAAVQDKNTPADEIAKKLAALHEARQKAVDERAAAQKDLKDILTARQEAVLVQMGMLD